MGQLVLLDQWDDGFTPSRGVRCEYLLRQGNQDESSEGE